MIEPGTLALLALLGAVLGLDGVSFPQAMLSRPLVAATIGGAVCGNTGAGLLVGILLECFALETMPFGASRYPEWGPASLAAGVVAAVPGGDLETSARIVPFAVVAGLGAAMLAGRTLIWLRRFNLSVAARRRDRIATGDASAVVGLQWAGLGMDFLRAGAITAAFILVLVPARDAVLSASRAPGALAVAVAGTLGVGVAGSAYWKVVHSTRGYAWWLLAGVLAGLAVVVRR
jgi:PTS system mannose-specific IIC component